MTALTPRYRVFLRGPINEIKEYIDLLMTQSAVIQEQRRLLQHQQGVQPLAITEQLDFTCPETSFVNVLDIKSTQDSAVSGPSLELKGTTDFSACHPRSDSILVCDNSCAATSSYTRWVPPGRPSLLFNHPQNVKVARPSRASYLVRISQDVVDSSRGLHSMSLLLCFRGGWMSLGAYSEYSGSFDVNGDDVVYAYTLLQQPDIC
ncbi:hypothetical protein BDR07DRAFT_1491672 [Suillus spraguei]|nr:hypothetical protein BDR07DRAFT_1491672 [Suillus spraguei]